MSKEERFALLNTLSFNDKFFDNENKENLDSLDVVRILNHYDKTLTEFVKRDVEQQDKISDLEAKLAESEEKLRSSWYEICPRCGNPYGASQFIRENGEVICSNCMKIEDIYEPLVKQLKQQLAEKDDEIERLKELKLDVPIQQMQFHHNQDKISFAVEQLIEIRDYVKECWGLDKLEGKVRLDIAKKIRLKIEQLKEGK